MGDSFKAISEMQDEVQRRTELYKDPHPQHREQDARIRSLRGDTNALVKYINGLSFDDATVQLRKSVDTVNDCVSEIERLERELRNAQNKLPQCRNVVDVLHERVTSFCAGAMDKPAQMIVRPVNDDKQG